LCAEAPTNSTVSVRVDEADYYAVGHQGPHGGQRGNRAGADHHLAQRAGAPALGDVHRPAALPDAGHEGSRDQEADRVAAEHGRRGADQQKHGADRRPDDYHQLLNRPIERIRRG